MDVGIERLSGDARHAYGVAVRGLVVAHVWWDGAADRRGSAGWYLRDLRMPAAVERLPVADSAVGALAADTAAEDHEWADAAEALARRTTPIALDESRYAIRDSPWEAYEVHVGGLCADELTATLPGLGVRGAGEVKVVSGRLSNSELADVLGCVRALGGTVTAVQRVRPGLR